MIKKTLMAVAACLPLAASAQVLHIEMADTALQKGAVLWTQSGQVPLKFSDKGIFEYKGEGIKETTNATLLLPTYEMFSVVMEQNKKQVVKISRKNGKAEVKYSGANVALSQFLNGINQFYPARDYNYEQNNPSADTISYADAFKKLDSDYAGLKKLTAKISGEHDRMICTKSLAMRMLKNRIALQQSYLQANHKDIKADPTLKSMMAEILPNDSDHANMGLVSELVNYSVPMTVDENTDVTEYAIQFLETADRLISDQKIKSEIMDGMVSGALNAEKTDVDKFWAVVCRLCPKTTVDAYQFIVDSKKTTQKGMQCPDATFSDADGKQHKLSEFFGKVLYIDLWATWCGPCCMEIPYLEKMVEHYKGNGKIQFISISLDRNRNAWLKKIAADKPAWPQFNANKEEDEAICKQWGVSGIPRFLIINADGTICNADAFRPSDGQFIEKIDALLK